MMPLVHFGVELALADQVLREPRINPNLSSVAGGRLRQEPRSQRCLTSHIETAVLQHSALLMVQLFWPEIWTN